MAVAIAILFGMVALYVTRPAPPPATTGPGFVGQDHPSLQPPDPLTPDEIGYQVPRDRIKAIDAPSFVVAAAARFVPDRTPVIGVALGGESRAYPISVLSRVEIVNDQIRGRAIAVTW